MPLITIVFESYKNTNHHLRIEAHNFPKISTKLTVVQISRVKVLVANGLRELCGSDILIWCVLVRSQHCHIAIRNTVEMNKS